MTGERSREWLVWLVVLAVPPGVGVLGFVAVAIEGGDLTLRAIGAGGLVAAGVAALVLALRFLGEADAERAQSEES